MTVEITKSCTKCNVVKTLSEFNNAKKGKYGKDSRCKECRKLLRPCNRKHNIKSKYNISLEIYEGMLIKQDNKCGICNKVFGSNLRPAIDHCHKTGVVRGVLCINCNSGLGFIEKEGFLSSCVGYLKEYL